MEFNQPKQRIDFFIAFFLRDFSLYTVVLNMKSYLFDLALLGPMIATFFGLPSLELYSLNEPSLPTSPEGRINPRLEKEIENNFMPPLLFATAEQLQLHLLMPTGECGIPEKMCWRILLMKLRVEPVRSLGNMTSAWGPNKTSVKVLLGPL